MDLLACGKSRNEKSEMKRNVVMSSLSFQNDQYPAFEVPFKYLANQPTTQRYENELDSNYTMISCSGPQASLFVTCLCYSCQSVGEQHIEVKAISCMHDRTT